MQVFYIQCEGSGFLGNSIRFILCSERYNIEIMLFPMWSFSLHRQKMNLNSQADKRNCWCLVLVHCRLTKKNDISKSREKSFITAEPRRSRVRTHPVRPSGTDWTEPLRCHTSRKWRLWARLGSRGRGAVKWGVVRSLVWETREHQLQCRSICYQVRSLFIYFYSVQSTCWATRTLFKQPVFSVQSKLKGTDNDVRGVFHLQFWRACQSNFR